MIPQKVQSTTYNIVKEKSKEQSPHTRRSPRINELTTTLDNDYSQTVHNGPQAIPYEINEIEENVNRVNSMSTIIEQPYQICLSSNPFNNEITVIMTIKGNHSTLGLSLI